MGSLRNPIGPLPSSIYWRRRAVALVVLAILVLLAFWVFALSGSGGTDDQGKNGGGGGPVSTITPGPTESGPAISERPGGREAVGGGSDAGSSSGGSSSGASGGSGGGGTGEGGTGEGGGSGGDGGADDGASGDGSGWKPGGPADAGSEAGSGGAKLPACAEPDVAVTLRSVEKAYEPGEKPEFELKAENDGGKPCSFDLGGKSTVVTVTDAADEDFWTSDDCRRAAKPATVQVPAKGEATRTFTWLRKPSAPDCGTPPAGSAAPGMYSAEVEIDGLKKAYAPFELEKT